MWEQKPQTALAAAIRTTGIWEGCKAATVASKNVDMAEGESCYKMLQMKKLLKNVANESW